MEETNGIIISILPVVQNHLSCSFPSNLPGILSKKWSFHFLCGFMPHLSDYPCLGSQSELKLNQTKPFLRAQNSSFVLFFFNFHASLICWYLPGAEVPNLLLKRVFSWSTKSRRFRKLHEKCPCSCQHYFQDRKLEETSYKFSESWVVSLNRFFSVLCMKMIL